MAVLGTTEMKQGSAALRGQAIDVLAAPLGGDKLAAEYLLLQLVSRCRHADNYETASESVTLLRLPTLHL